MAFRTFLYLDGEKVAEYSSTIHAPTQQATSKKSLTGALDLGVAKIGGGIESSGPDTSEVSPAVLYDAFEVALQKRANDDYFDCTSDDADISTLPQMSIARCEGQIEIPESFDMLATISEYIQPLRSLGLVSLDENPATTDFALSFFDRTNADIPILIQGNDILIASKLKSNALVEANYQTLEDCEDEDFFILFKVHSITNKESTVIFDPAKDFLKLSRSLRRSMKSTDGLEPITVNEPVLKAEIIAIYH